MHLAKNYKNWIINFVLISTLRVAWSYLEKLGSDVEIHLGVRGQDHFKLIKGHNLREHKVTLNGPRGSLFCIRKCITKLLLFIITFKNIILKIYFIVWPWNDLDF